MIKHEPYDKAFTIIELLIVIVVIGILAAIGIVSYGKVQANTRDAQRSVSIISISNALETYYQKNGEYPSCNMMSGTASSVANGVLSGLSVDSLATPTAANGANSIQASCADLVGAADLYSYIGDNSANCMTGSSCSRYVLRYKEDTTGNIITVKSRYGIDKSFASTWGGPNSENASTIAKTTDGGYVIVGETYSFGSGGFDAYLSKFNSSGVLSWSKTYGSSGDDFSCAVIETKDGGLAVAGFTSSYGSGNNDAYIVKYTSSGVLSWSRTWGGNDDDRAYSMIQTADGGFIVGGYTVSYDVWNGDAFVAKFTSIGDLSWSRVFGDAGPDYINGIVQNPDGSYMVVGDTTSYSPAGYLSGDYDGFLANIRSNGELAWFKMVGGSSVDSFKGIIRNSDNTFTVVGYTNSFGAGDKDALIAKFSSMGDLQWSKTMGGSAEEYFRTITSAADGGFAIGGYTLSYGKGAADAMIAKYTKDGDLSWARTFGGPSTDQVWSIVQAIDAGFTISGYTYLNSAGSTDGFIAKFTSDGAIINCSTTNCLNTNPSVSTLNITASVQNATNSLQTAISVNPMASSISQNATSRIIVAP